MPVSPPRAPTTDADEADLRRGLRRRDRECWDRVARRYEGALFRIARRVIKNPEDVRDAVAETWYRALRAARRYDANRSPLPWLSQLCWRTALNMARDRRHEPSAVDPLWLQDVPATERPLVPGEEWRAAVAMLLRALPAPAREGIHLHFLVGVSVRELALLSGRKIAATYQQLHRALRALRAEARARWGTNGDALLDP